MVNTYRNDTLDRGGGDWLFDKEEGTIYMKNYEFLECHEWWTEMETVQAEKGKSALFFIIEQEIMTEKGWFFIKKA